jgi:PKD repeat protein
MRKIFLLTAFIIIACFNYSNSQILCIYCYDQNDSISSGVNNLLLNGSFENNNCTPNTNASSYCSNSFNYNCTIPNWVCTGGGINTYASIWTNSLTVVPDGNVAPYFGNDFCYTCSSLLDDTSCLVNVDCTVNDVPAGFPHNSLAYGNNGVSLEQTVSGLVVGNTYVLEFWAGGENFGNFTERGMFALDVGFGDTLLRCKPSAPGSIASTYIIIFNATSASQTIRFTNWGHICSSCTELILDNVRLYTLAELSSFVPSCILSVSSFSSSDSAVCEKFCVDFYDSSTTNPTAWLWEFEGGSPTTSTNQNPIGICYSTPGTYDVTLITTTANGNDTLLIEDYVTVHPTPDFPDITQSGYTLTSSPANSYQWQLNSTDIPGATNQSYDVLQSGLYTVVISDSNDCTNAASIDVLITGITETKNNMTISVYPNPSSGNFIVEWMNGSMIGEVSIDVVNTVGQTVFSTAEEISSSQFKKEINLVDVANGVYFIEIKTENNLSYPYFSTVRKKVLITK